MSRIRTVVVGAGHLGRIHAQKLRTLGEFELVAVVDTVESARAAAVEQFQVPVDADHRAWVGRVDAAVIAAPTTFHAAVAADFLSAGVHTFVEKPLASTVPEAARLAELAASHSAALQVGHVERFNPAWSAVAPLLGVPRHIECTREGQFSFRSTDIGVVFDLMIHDIDLVLALAKSSVVDVEARGTALLGAHEDTAQARLLFANGCRAVLSASRVSRAAVRRMHVQTDDHLATIDFNARTAAVTHVDPRLVRGEIDVETLSAAERETLKQSLFTEYLHQEMIEAPPSDAITAELQDFAAAIRSGRRPQVSGREGVEAVRVAEWIVAAIADAKPAERDRRDVLRGPHWKAATKPAAGRRAG